MHETMTQERTGAEMALDYARGVAADLALLALLADEFDAVADYVNADEDEQSDAREQLALDDEELAAVVSLYNETGADDAGDLVQHWLDGILDTEVSGRYSLYSNEWEVTEVAFLVAYGGPTCRVRWEGTETLTVECSWGSHTVTVNVECAPLADYADALADRIG